jgi:hypothetical protein
MSTLFLLIALLYSTFARVDAPISMASLWSANRRARRFSVWAFILFPEFYFQLMALTLQLKSKESQTFLLGLGAAFCRGGRCSRMPGLVGVEPAKDLFQGALIPAILSS